MAVSDKKLQGLHEALAEVLATQISATDSYVDEQGELVTMSSATPALLAVAAKFLKDNQITCTVEEDHNLGALEDLLSKKQKKGRLTLANASEAAQEREH